MGNPIREMHFDGCLQLFQVELYLFGVFSGYEVVATPLRG
jgi:hypothetical protein